jgi:tRNA(His) 5'-end guanylyltransferase
MASVFFYKAHELAIKDFVEDCKENDYIIPEWIEAHYKAQESKLAVFDCRAFVLPKDEVNNYFLWRQKDCERNAVSMVARTLFSDKELEGKSTEERKQMMAEKHKVDWNLILSFYRKGVCVRKYECVESFTRSDGTKIEVPRKRWNVAKCIPSFQEHPEYINELVNI